MGGGVALEARDTIGRWGPLVDEEAGRAEELRVEAEDAGRAEAAEDAAVADVVEEAALLNAAVAAYDNRAGGDGGHGGGVFWF